MFGGRIGLFGCSEKLNGHREGRYIGHGFMQLDTTAVPPRVFRSVECLVCTGECDEGSLSRDGFGEADAEGEREVNSRAGELANDLRETFDDGLGVFGRGLGKEKEKFVSSVATEVVVGAEASGDGVGDEADGVVAYGVADGVVDGFKVVDIDESDGERGFAALDALAFDGETMLDASAVEDAAYRIMFGFVANDRQNSVVDHVHKEETDKADVDDVADKSEGEEGVAVDVVLGRTVDEKNRDAADANEGVEHHAEAEEKHGDASLGVLKKLEASENADDGDRERCDDNAWDEVGANFTVVKEDGDGCEIDEPDEGDGVLIAEEA